MTNHFKKHHVERERARHFGNKRPNPTLESKTHQSQSHLNHTENHLHLKQTLLVKKHSVKKHSENHLHLKQTLWVKKQSERHTNLHLKQVQMPHKIIHTHPNHHHQTTSLYQKNSLHHKHYSTQIQ